jgi:hypothetical protein
MVASLFNTKKVLDDTRKCGMVEVMKIPLSYRFAVPALLAFALLLSCQKTRAGQVFISTPDGIIAGNVGGDFTSLVTPYGMITGSTGSNPVMVNLPSTTVVIQPGVPTLFCH